MHAHIESTTLAKSTNRAKLVKKANNSIPATNTKNLPLPFLFMGHSCQTIASTMPPGCGVKFGFVSLAPHPHHDMITPSKQYWSKFVCPDVATLSWLKAHVCQIPVLRTHHLKAYLHHFYALHLQDRAIKDHLENAQTARRYRHKPTKQKTPKHAAKYKGQTPHI